MTTLDPERAVALRTELLGKLAHEHGVMLSVLEHLPEDRLDYRIHQDVRSFAGLAHHIYRTGPWIAGIIADGRVNTGDAVAPAPPSTKSDLIAACGDLHRRFITAASGFSGETLAREIAFFTLGTFPAVSLIDWHINHLIHHRGQLTMYLRVMGAKVPAVYGDSRDYPMKLRSRVGLAGSPSTDGYFVPGDSHGD